MKLKELLIILEDGEGDGGGGPPSDGNLPYLGAPTTSKDVGTVYPKRFLRLKKGKGRRKGYDCGRNSIIRFNKLMESMDLIKFRYTNNSKETLDSRMPKVKVLDFEYKGRQGQKSYGKRNDLLGWNLNYYSNKEEASKTIDDIDTFARMVSDDKKKKYERIKNFFPEQHKLLRRYNRKHIKFIKFQDGNLWKKTDINSLIHKDKVNV